MSIPTLNESSTFYSGKDDAGTQYETLVEALEAALAVDRSKRSRSAKIITLSGAEYGWEAIDHLGKNIGKPAV